MVSFVDHCVLGKRRVMMTTSKILQDKDNGASKDRREQNHKKTLSV